MWVNPRCDCFLFYCTGNLVSPERASEGQRCARAADDTGRGAAGDGGGPEY